MAYIGNIPAESYASFETQTFSTSATTSYTLSHAVTNENEIALFINSIRQQPGSGKSYTASNTTLTLSAATASSDTMYCVYLGRALQTVNPPNGSVGADQLASSAVTTAKINASAVDNTKVASTIITGQTAESTIADADTILIHDASASALKKMTKANFVSGLGGITEADQWRLTASITSNTDITSNLERVDTSPQSYFGTGMSQSSGIFTFPSTGYWWVLFTVVGQSDNSGGTVIGQIMATTNNSSYSNMTYGGYGASDGRVQTFTNSTLIDVTDTSNVKVKFNISSVSNSDEVYGSSTENRTNMTFIRLGDT